MMIGEMQEIADVVAIEVEIREASGQFGERGPAGQAVQVTKERFQLCNHEASMRQSARFKSSAANVYNIFLTGFVPPSKRSYHGNGNPVGLSTILSRGHHDQVSGRFAGSAARRRRARRGPGKLQAHQDRPDSRGGRL